MQRDRRVHGHDGQRQRRPDTVRGEQRLETHALVLVAKP